MLATIAACSCAWAACSQPAQGEDTKAPRTVDLAAIDAAAIPREVLRECHGKIQGMDCLAGRVWLKDNRELRVYARLPVDIRVEAEDGDIRVANDNGAWQLRATADGPREAVALTGADATELDAFRALIDVAALGPLRRATGCERIDSVTYRLSQPAGPPWQLTLRPDTLLVPRAKRMGQAALLKQANLDVKNFRLTIKPAKMTKIASKAFRAARVKKK